MKFLFPLIVFSLVLVYLLQPGRAEANETTIQSEVLVPLGITATPTSPPVNTPSPATPTPTPGIVVTPQLTAGTACLRFNFEVTGDIAQEGSYEVVEVPSGRSLATWYAKTGWQDSGWIYNINISFEAVHVKVLYHSAYSSTPVEMAIANPAPDTSFGWVARGMCHAIEIGWP